MNKLKRLLVGMAPLLVGAGAARADYALNLPRGATQISQELYRLHMLVLWVCVLIGVIVFSVIFYSIYHHRKSKGAVAATFHESPLAEAIWTIIPFVILVSMAIPATRAMMDVDDIGDPDMTIKVTGYQWKWRYEYIDDGIDFFSSLAEDSNKARQLRSGIDPAKVEHYLLDVDKPLVVPVNKRIRFLFTGADVVHSWWVKDLGWKKDTIPGYVTEAWTSVEKPGVYRGQCAELCGRDHAFMPIVVVAKTEDAYLQWVQEQKAAQQAAGEDADRTWTTEELVAKGGEVYQASCASCHMADGAGVPGNFPAITGSPVAAGPLAEHVRLVLQGRGDVMPAFGDDLLSDTEIAAVVTYQRNALGNSVGDSVQPSEIKNYR